MSEQQDHDREDSRVSSLGDIETNRRLVADPAQPAGSTVEVPSQIGPYKILETIGHGGMGHVFKAEQQEPVKRRVALKVIRTDAPSKEVLARFEAERQALAMMDHQNIAKVLDAGITEDGRPYFAMELVKGMPITEYCDENRLDPSERLELFIQVCRATQHAHQKQIIHRDLKPSNILVTLSEGKPLAKVIDFGLAKAIEDTTQLANRTLNTHQGQVLGTLAYMSPEQAKMNAMDVDTRTDVYSLGVILYELLTGTTPITRERIKTEAFDQILASIREEEIPRPSTRLSSSGDSIDTISGLRQTEARRLNSMLRGDLDWIAIKALEKNPSRRYDGASAIADDIERFLKNEPVEARPPSFRYRLHKSIRKNTKAFVTVAAFAILLIASLIVTSILWQNANRLAIDNQAKADENAEKASEIEKLANEYEMEKNVANLGKELLQIATLRQGAKFGLSRNLLSLKAYRRITDATIPVPENLQALVSDMIHDGIPQTSGRLVKTQEKRIEKYSRCADGLMLTSFDGVRFYTSDGNGTGIETRIDNLKSRGICVSRDGKTVYTAHYGPIKEWKYNGSKWIQQRFFPSPTGGDRFGHSLAISADNRWLVSGGWNGSVLVYDLSNKETVPPRVVKTGKTNVVWRLSISNSGCLTRQNQHCHWVSFDDPADSFTVCSGDGIAHPTNPIILSAEAGELFYWTKDESNEWQKQRIDSKRKGIRLFGFSPTGNYAAATADDGVVRIWDWNSTDPTIPTNLNLQSKVVSCDFNSSDTKVAMGTETGNVEVRSLEHFETAKPIVFASHAKPATTVAFIDDQTVYSADDYGTIRENDSERSSFFELEKQLEDGVAVVSYDQKWIVTGLNWFLTTYFNKKPTKVFLRSNTEPTSIWINPDNKEIKQVMFSPTSDSLLVNYWGNDYGSQTYSLCTFKNSQLIASELEGFKGHLLAHQWSDDGKKFALLSRTHLGIWIRNQEKWSQHRLIERPMSKPHLDRNLKMAAWIDDKSATILSLEDPDNPVRLTHDKEIEYMELDANGKFLAAVDQNGKLIVWELKSSKRILEHQTNSPYCIFSFDGNSKRLAVGARVKLMVFDIDSGLKREFDFEARIRNIAFVPETNRLVIFESHEPGVAVGETQSLQRSNSSVHFVSINGDKLEARSSPSFDSSSLFGPVFSPGGKWMTCDDREGRVHLWNLQSDSPENSRRLIGRHLSWVNSTFLTDDRLFSVSEKGWAVVRNLKLDEVVLKLAERAGRTLTERERIQFGFRNSPGTR